MSHSKCVDNNLTTKLAVALKNTCLRMFLHLFGCNITDVGAKVIADMLKHKSALEWIGLKSNTNTFVILLLETTDNYSTCTSVCMLMLDEKFHVIATKGQRSKNV